jgi:hypothetical protein
MLSLPRRKEAVQKENFIPGKKTFNSIAWYLRDTRMILLVEIRGHGVLRSYLCTSQCDLFFFAPVFLRALICYSTYSSVRPLFAAATGCLSSS